LADPDHYVLSSLTDSPGGPTLLLGLPGVNQTYTATFNWSSGRGNPAPLTAYFLVKSSAYIGFMNPSTLGAYGDDGFGDMFNLTLTHPNEPFWNGISTTGTGGRLIQQSGSSPVIVVKSLKVGDPNGLYNEGGLSFSIAQDTRGITISSDCGGNCKSMALSVNGEVPMTDSYGNIEYSPAPEPRDSAGTGYGDIGLPDWDG
jgi:hypothetical protein